MMERDTNLDKYRGLVMAYIVCVIHLVYWMGFGDEPWRSYILFEMPVVFFISGAAHRMSKPKPFGSFLIGRLKRIVAPYYIWAIVSLLLSLCIYFIKPDYYTGRGIMLEGIIAPFCFVQSWLIPKSSHIWFILPFIIIMLIAPVIRRILTSNRRIVVACVILVAMLVAMDYLNFVIHVKIPSMVYYIVVYSFFFILGFLYKKINIKGKHLLLGGMLILLLALGIIVHGMYSPSIQNNKFPPNVVFLLYNLGILCVLCVIAQKIKIPDWKWIDEYNIRGYSIYLYQNWVFFVFSMVFIRPMRVILPDVILFLPSLITLFFIHKMTSKYIYRMEQVVLSWIFKK